MMNGKFCSYHALNPQLNKLRNINPLIVNPAANDRASKVFEEKWSSTIKACIKGPVDSNLEPLNLSNDYYKEIESKTPDEE